MPPRRESAGSPSRSSIRLPKGGWRRCATRGSRERLSIGGHLLRSRSLGNPHVQKVRCGFLASCGLAADHPWPGLIVFLGFFNVTESLFRFLEPHPAL